MFGLATDTYWSALMFGFAPRYPSVISESNSRALSNSVSINFSSQFTFLLHCCIVLIIFSTLSSAKNKCH